VLFQYIFTVAGAAVFLFSAGKLPMLEKAASAFLIVAAIVNCGALFELKKWVYIGEFIRLALTGIFIEMVFNNSTAVLLFALLFLMTSVVWLIKLKSIFYKSATSSLQKVA
jgi:hypothetical protein